MVKKNKMKVRTSRRSNRGFDALVYLLLGFVALITLVPILYVVAASLTPYDELAKHGGLVLIPSKVTLEAYKTILNNSDLWQGMKVTVTSTVLGTICNLIVTLAFAYPLSRAALPGRKMLTKLVMFTMIFSAGTVPTYLVVKETGMLNSIWSYIVPSLVSVSNLIIMKAFFEGLPEDIFDAARIDGCGEFMVLFKIVLPMAVPILLTIGMYYAVAHWNQYMAAVLYITDSDLNTMQVVLRRILTSAKQDFSADTVVPEESLRMAAVVVSTLPIVVVYPFIQKYFVKGTLAGAVKG